MTGVQGEIFHTPTILLSGAVSGEEEAKQLRSDESARDCITIAVHTNLSPLAPWCSLQVPDGVLGVLVRSAKDRCGCFTLHGVMIVIDYNMLLSVHG